VATVNGVAIPTASWRRYQGFIKYRLQLEEQQLRNELYQLQSSGQVSQTPLIQQLLQQSQYVQRYLLVLPAYTLQQMELVIEVEQAAGRLGIRVSSHDIAVSYARAVHSYDAARGKGALVALFKKLGVTPDDMRTYYFAESLVQQRVTIHFGGKAPATQPWAIARHILVTTVGQATAVANQVRLGVSFATLAKKYSIDNGLPIGSAATGAAAAQAHASSSAYNGGWLRDPNPVSLIQARVTPSPRTHEPGGATAIYQPTWLTPNTRFVRVLLDAILTMRAGEVRVVQSQFGYHVVQVFMHETHRLSAAEKDTILLQQGQTKFRAWYTGVTAQARNKLVPPDPYKQFPAPTPPPIATPHH